MQAVQYKFEEETIMKPKTCAAIAAFLVLLILGFLIWSLSAPDPRPQGFKSEKERAYVAGRHRHHGIFMSRPNYETGEAYFIRDGVKCRL